MKWEYKLMRDMLERAGEYTSVNTFECMKTAAMLKQAHNVMSNWNRKIVDLEIALKKIKDCDWPAPIPLVASRADFMQQIAKEALE